MTDKPQAWLLPGQYERAVLPDGAEVGKMEANSLGYQVTSWPDSARTASPHPDVPGVVRAERGVVMDMQRATANMFTIVAADPRDDRSSWRAAIIKSPEANARPAAAAEVLATQSPASMSADKAIAFLRGLPAEATAPKAVAPVDAKAARRNELAASMRGFNRANGYSVKPGDAPDLSTIPADRLQRLAEMRLGALTMRMEQGESSLSRERMNLQYALKATATTGTPLAQSLKAVGIDPASIVRGN